MDQSHTNISYSREQIAKTLDHSILKPMMKHEDIIRSIYIGIKYDVASICIMPSYLNMCCDLIAKQNSLVKSSTVIGFPHGNTSTEAKVYEAKVACDMGAQELDMVVNISDVISGRWGNVCTDIEAVYKQISYYHDVKMKVIFENCYLTEHQKITLCEICNNIMATGWVKTSTGFGTSGATIEDVELMRKYTKPELGVKAAGGVKTLAQVLAMKKAGADRCGCSVADEIMSQHDNSVDPPF